jgi:hypothetical protein
MIGRRSLVGGVVGAFVAGALERRADAEEPPVPAARQAELLARIAGYDRNLAARAQGTARVVIVQSPDDADSRTLAVSMETALNRIGRIGGLPVAVSTVRYTSGDDVAQRCRTERVSIVYLSSGLDPGVAPVVARLDGVDVLSVAGLPRYVAQGIVLGFDLVSGSPTLLFHLTNARRQNVAMDPKVVSLMQVYR